MTITKYVNNPDGGFSIYKDSFLFILSENKDTIADVMIAIGVLFFISRASYFREKRFERSSPVFRLVFTFLRNLGVKVYFSDEAFDKVIGFLLIVFGGILRAFNFVSGATI